MLQKQLASLLEGCTYVTTNCANTAALLMDTLPELNWAGFYFLKENALLLGPFCGKPACLEIPMGKGVCGTAAQKRETLVVENVHAFPGHIACDSASNSEIVIPLLQNGVLLGVLDIDSPVCNRFSEQDKIELEQIAKLLVDACDWEHYQFG